MVFRQPYFHDGYQRWDFGFATPNYAGAALATLLPFAWALWGSGGDFTRVWTRYSIQRYAGTLTRATTVLRIAIEFALIFSLGRTYSRGAFVAIIVAILVGWLSGVEKHVFWLWRVATAVTALALSGLLVRAAPSAAFADASVLNRGRLWSAACEMMANTPLTGWGAGESGRVYMNWYQDTDRLEGYSTTVNSYLDIGVNFGGWALWIIMFFIFSVALLSLSILRTNKYACGRLNLRHRYAVFAGASVAAWLIANIFSTLWIEPVLWFVPAVASGVFLSYVFPNSNGKILLDCGKLAAFGATAVVFSILLFGWLGTRSRSYTLTRGSQVGELVLTIRKAPIGRDLQYELWLDSTVLGPVPGRAVRALAAKWPEGGKFIIHEDGFPANVVSSRSNLFVLFGRQSRRLGEVLARTSATVILVNPRSGPPHRLTEFFKKRVLTILPQVDEYGNGAAWAHWAAVYGQKAAMVPGGQDITPYLDELLDALRSEISENSSGS